MATAFTCKATGEKQGWIQGNCRQKGRENTIEGISMSHQVVSPRDAASGQATGKRQHKPLRFRAYTDRALPLLYQALTKNEAFKEVVFDFYMPNVLNKSGGQGVETLTYKITLKNAFLATVESELLNLKNPELQRYEMMYSAEFVYEEIIWLYTDGNKTGQDNWLGSGT